MAGGDAAQAEADARQAIVARAFGLINSGEHEDSPTGVLCFTPQRQAPETLLAYGHSDFITPDVSANLRYAQAYNRLIVDHPDYPHAELCRALADGDGDYRQKGLALLGLAAREVKTRPRDLFEAARRGSLNDVRNFLTSANVNRTDGVHMTALGWAVARGNRPAFDALLAAGADPWEGGLYRSNSPVMLAAVLGRRAEFVRLTKGPRPDFGPSGWPSWFLRGALAGGDQAIVNQMLAEPNQGVRINMLASPLPSVALLEAVLRRQPDQADALLLETVRRFGEPLRTDLVRLALAHGANPNVSNHSRETPLISVANGIHKGSVEAVTMLLKAGADPNLMPHRERPIWSAVRSLKLDGEWDEFDQRAKANFNQLIAAGADLKLPDGLGRPPIWALLFPHSGEGTVMDASFVTPELIDLLVRNGMDVNAEWKDKRVLGLVEAQPIKSKWAWIPAALKAHGAKP